MFHVSTKQRLAALRRKYGLQLTAPKWARERSRRFKEAATAIKAARDEARRQIVAALTPAPMAEMTPAGMFAMAGGPADSPTTVADAPYPSQHLSATDANRSRSSGGGGGGSGGGDGEPGGSKRWLWIVLLVALALGLVAWCGLSGKKEQVETAPAPAPVQAVAPAPEPPPPPPPPPAPKQLTVVKGDCLWCLSATHLGDAQAWRRLYEANRDKIRNPDLIYPGQVLDLP